MFRLSSILTRASVSASIKISHLARFYCAGAHIEAIWNSVWPNFFEEKKVPENDWWIPLTFSYIGAMKIIHSVIYGSNYQNTCNYELIHVRKPVFDHFSRFRLSTLVIALVAWNSSDFALISNSTACKKVTRRLNANFCNPVSGTNGWSKLLWVSLQFLVGHGYIKKV